MNSLKLYSFNLSKTISKGPNSTPFNNLRDIGGICAPTLSQFKSLQISPTEKGYHVSLKPTLKTVKGLTYIQAM